MNRYGQGQKWCAKGCLCVGLCEKRLRNLSSKHGDDEQSEREQQVKK